MSVPVDPRDTKQRILDAAESLFAEKGFAGTSLRNITTLAGANLAAVNYHFGSKEALVEAVFVRRCEPMNHERLAELDTLESRAGSGAPELERVIEAFVGPVLRASRDPERGGTVFMRLLGHAMSQPKDEIRELLASQFREIARRFSTALGRALPGLDPTEVFWRMAFMVGSMAHTMAMADHFKKVSRGVCDPTDEEEIVARLVPFLTAAMRSPAVKLDAEETP
ncbi:MAG: TetR/AcrR family transcriptional regulator [bacterium]|nr:TetR/AcrR family transcriptional regulator [bacterium]